MGSAVFRQRGMTDVPGIEAAALTMEPGAAVRCAGGSPTQGQGHATTIAQIVGDRLGLPIESVRVLPGDSSGSPRGSGTFASRGTVAMLGSAGAAADLIAEKIRAFAAHRLEASADDVMLESGPDWVRGFPHRADGVAEIALLGV